MFKSLIISIERLVIDKTEFSPEIILDHAGKNFSIKGNSRPEDVRDIYFPVVTWMNDYEAFLQGEGKGYHTEDDPMVFEFDMEYFNSSTAKFLFDIVDVLRKMKKSGVPVGVAWIWDEEDTDMKEAGEDLSYLVEMDFTYIAR